LTTPAASSTSAATGTSTATAAEPAAAEPVTTRSWSSPWPVTGDVDHIRVSVTMVDQAGHRHCASNRALRARPSAFPVTPFTERRYPRFARFVLGLVRDAIVRAESDAVPAADAESRASVAARAVEQVLEHGAVKGDVPEAARRWMRHGVETYLDAAEDLNRADRLVAGPRAGWVVAGRRDGQISELTAWGLAYADPAGAVRELRLLRVQPMAGRAPMSAQAVAAAAFVTATGFRPAEAGSWRDPYTRAAAADPEPALVRVREVALLDGSDRIAWEGTRADAAAGWAPFGASLVLPLVNGSSLTPCRDCNGCKASAVCDALPTDPGLLGLPGFGTHPRTLAPTALDTWRRCPARYLLTVELGLPRSYTRSNVAMARGLAVHGWLEHAHARSIACTAADLLEPSPDDDGIPGDVAKAAELDAADYRVAWPFLRQHLDVCPLTGDGVYDVWPERDLAVLDPDADVLVLCRPDLLASTATGPLWRETKTVAQLPEATDAELLAVYPQVAVGICILADGSTGDPRLAAAGTSRALVELELLAPQAARLIRFDVLDESTVSAARRALAQAAYGWHRDDQFVARPGMWCTGCEVSRWCPSAQLDGVAGASGRPGLGGLPGEPASRRPVTIDGVTVDTATGEVLDASGQPRRPSAAESVVAASLLGTSDVLGPDDDVPF
jgi:PD-(D/E)XK nuclease superfamily